MKKVCSEQVFLGATLGLLLLPALTFARAVREDNHATAADSIDVIGHLPLTNASITSLKTFVHWRRQFLQLQD